MKYYAMSSFDYAGGVGTFLNHGETATRSSYPSAHHHLTPKPTNLYAHITVRAAVQQGVKLYSRAVISVLHGYLEQNSDLPGFQKVCSCEQGSTGRLLRFLERVQEDAQPHHRDFFVLSVRSGLSAKTETASVYHGTAQCTSRRSECGERQTLQSDGSNKKYSRVDRRNFESDGARYKERYCPHLCFQFACNHKCC